MRNIILCVVIIFLLVGGVFADLREEILFISNLHSDGYFDIALQEIERIEHRLEHNSLSHQVLLIKADILMRQSKWDEAVEILQKLNALSMEQSLQAQVILSLAQIEKLRGNHNEAFDLLNIYTSRYAHNPRIVEAKQLQGDLFFEQKRFDEAEPIYTDLHTKHRSAQSFVNMIHISLVRASGDGDITATKFLEDLKKEFPRATEEYQRGLLAVLTWFEEHLKYEQIVSLAPDKVEPKTVYSEAITQKKIAAHIHLKNYTEAEKLLAGITDDSRSVNYYRALIHKEKGEDQLALPIFRVLAGQNDDQIAIMSFFNMTQIIAKNNTAEAYEMLQQFLVENPDQPWEGDILYQLAFIEFQNKEYQKAYDYVQSALRFNLNNLNRQNAIYLKGELEFLLGNYASAFATFNDNLANIPEAFLDEAIFKLGLTSYFLGHRDRAFDFFNELVSQHPSSQKVGVAYYYLGEITLHTRSNEAKDFYQKALAGDMDRGVVTLRLAYVDYLREDYASAIATVNTVPDTADYLYDKYLLLGNIAFMQRQYPQAIEHYRQAVRNAPDRVSAEYALSRQAWTHYNMQEYDTATRLYRQLAEQSDNPGQFVLSAAGSAFNADNFDQAMTLYNEYISTFPTSPDLYRAKIGLANSYFNLARYTSAIEVWSELVSDRQSKSVVESSLRGLLTSYQRLNNLPYFTELLYLKIRGSQDRDFVIMLYEFKANYEYEQRYYESSIDTINELIRRYPEKANEQKIQILLANNYSWLQRYEDADHIYLALARDNENDPSIYYEWGHIKWAQKDYTAALTRYKRAADNSRNEQYWLTLLERQVENRDSEFTQYLSRFMQFASPYHQSLATMQQIEWLIQHRNYSEAMQQIETLLSADQPILRANANFKRGEVQFLQKDYNDALTSFLRIRYVFNQFNDLRYAAELYIAKIYLLQGKRDDAMTLFESIKGNLSAEQVAEFEALKG